ncbi:ribonuclease H-like domain-containing protein, partial [Mycena leptocephala]
MPVAKGPLWVYFHRSNKHNGSHYRATHWRCIDTYRPSTAPIDVDHAENRELMEKEPWFELALAAALEAACDVNGEKTAMAGHLRRCDHATKAEKEAAASEVPTKADKKAAAKRKQEKKAEGGDETDEGESSGRKKRKLAAMVTTSFSQSKLQVFRGIDIPFNNGQQEIVREQFLRATQSANLPERWVEDPEVLKLFLMFRGRALDVIPTHKELGGVLLQQASDRVDEKVAAFVRGKYAMMSTDGWRSMSKDAVTGVHLSVKFQQLLVDILRTNSWKKDGESMAIKFGEMIDKAESTLGCQVAGFLTDNDGGSKSGRNLLGKARPWFLVFPCCGHQGQLMLGDYIKESLEAAQVSEELVDFVHWLHSHDKVRDIFDKHQGKVNEFGTVYVYLVANLTRWTTHLVAFLRFRFLKTPIRNAILTDRDAIVEAQVGAEKNHCKAEDLRADAIAHCESVESNGWWDRLDRVGAHLLPYKHSPKRPSGLFLHFLAHPDRNLGQKMCKRIEKRWKELDQAVFILALVLNPFDNLTRFGDKANIDVFVLSTELGKLYNRVKSRPPPVPRSPAEDADMQDRARAVGTAFMKYLSKTGPFASWYELESEVKAAHVQLHGEDPISFWTVFSLNAQTSDLADFAIMLLELVVNQAGLERSFSDFLNKKNKKRNRLSLKKMAQQAKVTRHIRVEQYTEGLRQKREGRKNHS